MKLGQIGRFEVIWQKLRFWNNIEKIGEDKHVIRSMIQDSNPENKIILIII
jgi:hypothetical protein